MCRLLRFFHFFFLMIRRPPRSTPLSLHDALPICSDPHDNLSARMGAGTGIWWPQLPKEVQDCITAALRQERPQDRKSTRLNSSHLVISYAVFCLKKKNNLEKLCFLLLEIRCIDNV